MRTAKLLLILLVIGVIFIVLPSRGMIHASPAPYLNYQGRLENSNGDLLTGNYYIAFCIYNSTTATTCTPGSTPTVGSMSSAGTSSGTLNGALWGEVQYFSSSNTPSNEVENGVFNAELGKYSPLTGSIFENGSNFYIGVNVYNGSSWDGQMTPLEPIDQVAYSMDSALLNGYGASTTPGATQVVVTNSSGDITLSGTNPQINVEGTNTLTLNGGGGTGNIEFFNSSNYITEAGLMELQGGINTVGSSNSSIGVGSAGSGIAGGVIEFNSNGTSGTDGAYMEYIPPASGTNIASELHISGTSGGTLTDLQLVTNALNISNSVNGTTVSINGASGNISTAGNLTVSGTGSNTITGDTTLNNNLIVNGSSTVTGITNNGVLTNNGNGTFSGTLSVTGGSIDLGNSSSNLIESTTNLTLNPENTNTGSLNINTTSSLPAATNSATSVVYNGYVYEIGGYNGSANVATVDYAPINSNGTLGAWSSTTALPAATADATSVVYNGFIYEIGGCATSSCLTATVDYAPINSGGGIGSWSATTSLPAATGNATSVVYNGYVYEIGGCSSCSGTTVATVNYAPINSNGTLGSWTATTSLPAATAYATSVEYNGYVYEIGGYNGSAYVATVDYAPINSNGTLGSWTATTSLPAAIAYATSVEYNGYVYEIGGYNGGIVATVDYAPINSNGTLGSWVATTSLPAATDNATSVEYNGYLYEIGGYNGSAVVATVYSISVVTGNISLTNSVSGSNVLSMNGFSGDITTQGSINVGNINGGINTINGNTILTSADLNISGLSTPTSLAVSSSSNVGGQLSPGTYYYEVVAKDNTPASVASSFPSQYISETVNTPVPVPTGVSATVGTTGSVGSNLAASTTYYYEVTATTPNGETTASAEVSAAEGTTAYPITISWTAVNGATGYTVYKGTTSGGEQFLAPVSGGSTTLYTDSGNTNTSGVN
ncbi:hypothetical protein M1145_00345, partial [Patescibacteria group bacterium]|nr:hypothetical protein [Patescibacteria group bacterium]